MSIWATAGHLSDLNEALTGQDWIRGPVQPLMLKLRVANCVLALPISLAVTLKNQCANSARRPGCSSITMRVLQLTFLLVAASASAALGLAATVSGAFPVSADLVGSTVTLSNREQVFSAVVSSLGTFVFTAAEPGQYDFQISSTCGYMLKQPMAVRITAAADSVQLGNIGVQRYTVSGSNYSYAWSQDQTYAGAEATASVVAPTVITILEIGRAHV